MKTLKILDWPQKRFRSETHPFYKWNKQFREHGLKVSCQHDHLDKKFMEADYALIHSRYFDMGKNIDNGARQDVEYLIEYLSKLRQNVGKVIWFDAADSTGSSDFGLIPYVDVFLKKQLLKDNNYYLKPRSENDLRIWMNRGNSPATYSFVPCPANELHKLKVGWNIGLNDYRYFGYKLSRLSNYLPYSMYPLKYTEVLSNRTLDLTFRGTIHQERTRAYRISEQRNIILDALKKINGKIASGPPIHKSSYWKELRSSKLSISPYGWGEICYRDFETFIAGALLIKPSMEHLKTYPDIFKPLETYIPITWDLANLEEGIDYLIANFSDYQHIAKHGQEQYKNILADADDFVCNILNAIT
ncbi:MAG TPA: glycosyltransferase [Pelobium sp.]|nr:glycosyltransferase [Pelobium sp.]